jgi:hypothetical protein
MDAVADQASFVDASTDARTPEAQSQSDACLGSVAIVGGTTAGASTIAFAASLDRSGSWSVASLPSNVASPPAIAAFGGGFVSVFIDAEGNLESVASTWSWSSPGAVGGLIASGAPSLAVVGTSLHLVYKADSSKYFHGVYTAASGWDTADDPVGGAAAQGFGPSAPVAAGMTDGLAIAYGGEDGFLYTETLQESTWGPSTEMSAASVGTLAPAMVAMHGGPSEGLIVYTDARGTLHFTSRIAGTWSTPGVINRTAFTNAAPSLLALSGGRAMMTYLGTNQLPYFSVYDPMTTPTWTDPAQIGSTTSTNVSPPSTAAGVCGNEVIAVLTETEGVFAINYVGGTWLSPTLLEGTAGMTFASVASQP